jgi:endonuclease/exonuclease/phosphatase family metal-dependent hydrolase
MPAETLKIVTFNIHHAEGRDKVVDVKRIADLVKSIEADIVALQELDVRVPRSRNVDQPAALADALGMHVYFAPSMKLEKGEYGIALAGRHEFKATVQQLPRVAQEEPRVAIVASVHKIAVVATHLSRDAAARRAQTEHLAELAGQLGEPLIVLGDLNQPPKDLAPLTSKGLAPVKPASSLLRSLRPGRPIDHILTSNGIHVKSARVVSTKASDHAPLVAEIALG